MKTFSRFNIFLRAPAWQALLEAWAGVLLYTFLLTRLPGEIIQAVFDSPLDEAIGTGLMLIALCGAFWVAVRIQVVARPWWQRLLHGCALTLILGITLSLGVWLPARTLGWLAALANTPYAEEAFAMPLVGALFYPLLRLGMHLWLLWQRYSNRSMMLGLTNAILGVATGMILCVAILFNLLMLIPTINTGSLSPYADFPIGLLRYFLILVLPSFAAAVGTGILILLLLLPFAALFSFWMARKTTRRIERLAIAAGAFRGGNYQARVTVDGEDEVARLQADFNAMAEQLASTLADLKSERDTVSQVLQARRDLVANVSHELRTPVATLRAAIETTLAQPEVSPVTLQSKLELMEKEIQRLSGLIDDLFVLSQADVNNLRVNCAPTELRPVVEQVIATFAPLAWQSGRVEVSADLPQGLPAAQADAERLKQVLLNLLRNAVRYTPPGGVVAILAEAEADHVRIEVRDTGEGIDPDDLSHVWERFYRGKNATHENAGLGLPLVKELVEAMGGKVGATSIPGEGSCFTVWLEKPLATQRA